ncbi:pilus assembly protein TadG-related protein [Sulfitobacter sp. F26204]|uniref:pilus assembly protein TadG-related protein n=1 Tax=Sulfitobacter sp. F26204 TaxID=2996014 RepID=UPI00225E1F8A|nr:pilus assembly protein TadG-related protein [Sulfitobacter sp. F26204]MCX7561610.1 pilus assembly protein TadG-related protein [Sulfitobacter sp. F26204]
MPIKPNLWTSFAREESGAVAVIVSLLLTVLIGFVALGVDVAALYRERAKLQSDGDLAAMSSVIDTDSANARAIHALGQNDRGSETLNTLQTGRFLRNPEVAREDRFTPLPAGSPGINSVFLTLQDDAPLHFAKIFTDEDTLQLTRSSTAIRTGAASFSLNSNIIRLDEGGLNSLLSETLGAEVSLTAGEIEMLADAEVNIGDLLNDLDQRIGNAARNPAAILDAQTNAGQVLASLQSLLPSSVAGLIGEIASGGASFGLPIEAIIGGIDTELGLTAIEFASEIELSALDIVQAVASSKAYQLEMGLSADVSVPGVTSVTTRLAAGEPPARSGWVALGEEDVQLHRAAVRLETNIDLVPDLLGDLGVGISATRLNVPLYVEVAGATATLDEINCASPETEAVATRFTTDSTPLSPENGTSVAALYLGAINEDMFNSGPIAPSSVDFADILDVTLRIELPLLPDIVIAGVTIQARSNVALGQSQTEEITFTRAEVKAGNTTKYFGSGDLLSSGISSLLSPANTELRVKPGQEGLISGLAAPLVTTLLAVLPGQLLTTLAGPLDTVVDSALNSLGIRLGEGELELTGHHCELVRLVQ